MSPRDLVNRGAIDSKVYGLLQNEDDVIHYESNNSEKYKFKESTLAFGEKKIILR